MRRRARRTGVRRRRGAGYPCNRLSASQVGLAGSLYVAGACVGALVFGYLTDRWGRRNLFMVTMGVYLVGTALTAALSWNFWTFWLFRFRTGSGIGGEYAAINSAIDELIPARVRGRVDLAVNRSWWIGTAVGAALSLLLLNPHLLPPTSGGAWASGSASCWRRSSRSFAPRRRRARGGS